MGKVNGLQKMSSEKANNTGHVFFQNKEYDKAVECFRYAMQKDKDSPFSYFNMGVCFKEGCGVEKNKLIAIRYFVIAYDKDKNHELKCRDISEAITLSGADCNQIGDMYLQGNYVKKSSRTKAKEWYDRGREKGSAYSSFKLALYYEDRDFLEYSVETAVFYYNEAIEKGYVDAKKHLRDLFYRLDYADKLEGDLLFKLSISKKPIIKALTKERVLFFRKYYPDELHSADADVSGDTILHKTAKASTLKDCARLMLLGASTEPADKRGYKPFRYLSSDKHEKVTRLQTIIANLLVQLSESPITVLSQRISVDHGDLSKEEREQMLTKFCMIPEIAPLMDLAKFAALGLHKLKKPDYDSDDDDEPKYNSICDSQKLSIRLDATKETVDRLAYWDKDGQGGKNAYGVCTGNVIAIGILQKGERSSQHVCGTIIHELTHFLTNITFKNNYNPYADFDLERSLKFQHIVEGIIKKINDGQEIDGVIRRMFPYYCNVEKKMIHPYPSWCYARELIVRVPQMIIHYQGVSEDKGGDDGFTRLRKQAPELLDFYLNDFLPAIITEIEVLQICALGDWPQKWFDDAKAAKCSI